MSAIRIAKLWPIRFSFHYGNFAETNMYGCDAYEGTKISKGMFWTQVNQDEVGMYKRMHKKHCTCCGKKAALSVKDEFIEDIPSVWNMHEDSLHEKEEMLPNILDSWWRWMWYVRKNNMKCNISGCRVRFTFISTVSHWVEALMRSDSSEWTVCPTAQSWQRTNVLINIPRRERTFQEVFP